jgi:hypothetical protein
VAISLSGSSTGGCLTGVPPIGLGEVRLTAEPYGKGKICNRSRWFSFQLGGRKFKSPLENILVRGKPKTHFEATRELRRTQTEEQGHLFDRKRRSQISLYEFINPLALTD